MTAAIDDPAPDNQIETDASRRSSGPLYGRRKRNEIRYLWSLQLLMNVVAERIQHQLAIDEADARLCKSIFGSVDPAEISNLVSDTVSAGLGTTPSDVLFLEFSVGAAIGIRTEDGRLVSRLRSSVYDIGNMRFGVCFVVHPPLW